MKEAGFIHRTPPQQPAADFPEHERRVRTVVVLTAVAMLIELGAGSATGSLALLADGWHMATHVGVLAISSFVYWFARTRSADARFTFGTGKLYALAGYTSGISLGLAGLWMIVEAAERIATAEPIDFDTAFPIAVLGLAMNLFCAWLLARRASGSLDEPEAHAEHDHSFRAVLYHVLSDAVTSVLAIVALIAGKELGWLWPDRAGGALGGLAVLIWAGNLCRRTIPGLVDMTPRGDMAERLRDALQSIDDVRVAALHLWEVGPGRLGCCVVLSTSWPRAAEHYRAAVLKVAALAHLTVEVRHPRDAER